MDGLVYIGVFVVLLIVYILDRRSYRTGLPGPKGVPILGSIPAILRISTKDIFPWLGELINKHGSVFEIHYGPRMKQVYIADPVEAEAVLSSSSHIKKGYQYNVLKPWLREGLLLSGGAKWHNRRKLLTPTFHFKILEDSLARQALNADRLVERLLETNGEAVEIEDIVRTSALDIICDIALGINKNEDDKDRIAYASAVKEITKAVTVRIITVWAHNDFLFKLSPLGNNFYKNVTTLHEFSEKVIRKRKIEFQEKRDKSEKKEYEDKRYAFLDKLLEIDAQFPGQLSIRDIQEEVDTFTFEGHDTTATAVIFTLFLLSNHQVIQERAAKEQLEIFRSDTRHPGMKDLKKMEYLEMVIKESLRLYPSVPAFTRNLTKECVLRNGAVIPPGYNVHISPWFIHRNKDYWDEPEQFRPERFAPGQQRHPFSYIPFSAGPRNCIGQKFAMLELKIMLSAILRKCKLESYTKEMNAVMNIVIISENPIKLKVFPREP